MKTNMRGWQAALALSLLWAGTAHGLTDEEACIAGRIKAKGSYVSCVSKFFAKRPAATQIAGDDHAKLMACVDKYAAAWDKLKGLADSPTCGGLDRFVDNGTTVTDRLTLLTWEKKSGDTDLNDNTGDVHDPDNGYGISLSNDEDGAAFSIFLADLNAFPGLGNARSWRLPTLVELLSVTGQTVLGGAYSTVSSSTTLYQNDPGQVWAVNTALNQVEVRPKWGAIPVRAVRGGL